MTHFLFYKLKAGKEDSHSQKLSNQSNSKSKIDTFDSMSSIYTFGSLTLPFIILLNTSVLFLHEDSYVVCWCLFKAKFTTEMALGIPVNTLAISNVKSDYLPLILAKTFLKYRLKPNCNEHCKPVSYTHLTLPTTPYV